MVFVFKNVTGIMMDIMNLLEVQLNFSVGQKFYKEFGIYDDESDEWDGVMGGLVKNEVSLIAAELSITPEREKVSQINHDKPHNCPSSISQEFSGG